MPPVAVRRHAHADAQRLDEPGDECSGEQRDGLAQPMARYDLWLKITQDQLRILPPVEVCQSLMEGKRIERNSYLDLLEIGPIGQIRPMKEKPKPGDAAKGAPAD